MTHLPVQQYVAERRERVWSGLLRVGYLHRALSTPVPRCCYWATVTLVKRARCIRWDYLRRAFLCIASGRSHGSGAKEVMWSFVTLMRSPRCMRRKLTTAFTKPGIRWMRRLNRIDHV